MPKDYERERDAIIRKGVPEKDAKRIAAIDFYKKHGVAVDSVDKPKPKDGKK
jgi:hypothetical protein